MPFNAIVVGMPRSGTSLSASLLVNQGYYVAGEEKELNPGDEFNPAGYFEAEHLIENNVDAFKAVGFEHHNTWRYDAITAGQASALNELEPLAGHAAYVDEMNRQSPRRLLRISDQPAQHRARSPSKSQTPARLRRC